MAQKYSDNPIPNLNADWGKDKLDEQQRPYSGCAVQTFLKAQIRSKCADGIFDATSNTLYLFETAEAKEEAASSGDYSAAMAVVPFNFSGYVYKINFETSLPSQNVYYTQNQTTAIATFTPSSEQKEITAQSWSELLEDYDYEVSIDRGETGNYTTIATGSCLSGESFSFDIRNYISSQRSKVKVSVTGKTSEQRASYMYYATLTAMYLEPDSEFTWAKAFKEGETFSLGGWHIGGNLQKTFVAVLRDSEGIEVGTYTENIGSRTFVSSAYNFEGLVFPEAGTGIYSVECYVVTTDGLETEHYTYNIMCVAAADASTAQLLCVNEASDVAYNYSSTNLFKYSLYNAGLTEGTITYSMVVTAGGTQYVVADDEQLTVATEAEMTLDKSMEVETEESTGSVEVTASNGNVVELEMSLDNTLAYPATPGAIFYMNAATRSNAQSNRTKIINEVNGDVLDASWTANAMAYSDGVDGWTTDDEGRRCLLLQAGSKMTLPQIAAGEAPMGTFNSGKTIEFCFRVNNAADYDEPVITICNDASAANFIGIKIKPTNVTIHSTDLNSASNDVLQGVNLHDEEMVHVLITIGKNYNSFGSAYNLCKVFVNGGPGVEFNFGANDDWVNNAPLIVGSDTADVMLYKMRIYNGAFDFIDAITNYINTQDSDVRQSIYNSVYEVINDSLEIDFDKVFGHKNCFVVEMLNDAALPTFGMSKDYKAYSNFMVFWANNMADSFRIDNVETSGQGTTSMNYYRWNLRWRIDKSDKTTKKCLVSYWNTETGDWNEGSMSKTVKFDGDNHTPVIRLTGKKNYASSQQSHKMGSTAAFSDLREAVCGANEADAKTAVYQEPFYAFQKTADGYEFIGLYTLGPDKGDKPTFGYNGTYKDSILSMEGKDHDKKMATFAYPYTDETYVYQNSKDDIYLAIDKGDGSYVECWEIGNAGTCEEIGSTNDTTSTVDGDGNPTYNAYIKKHWKPAYDVAYNNSTMIMGTDTPIATINADPSAWQDTKDSTGRPYEHFEFWIDGEYDLYYYNLQQQQYVKNGVNLLTDCGITAEELVGLTIDEKNEMFKAVRRARFKTQMQNYWNLDDTLFHFNFCLIFGASDNFAKNSYPYNFCTDEMGETASKWRWRQDDLDTIFDIDNQGLATKGYSIEMKDFTDSAKTAYVFKGEQSVFWTLISEAFESENLAMGRRILQAMCDLSDTGTTSIAKLLGFFKKYYWGKAQEYFAKSAYNVDNEYAYEAAWHDTAYSTSPDVWPLNQALGDHYLAERMWVERRLIYCMSKYHFGAFSDYVDVCLGQLSFRTQSAQSFEITPAIDLYPAILIGAGEGAFAPSRVKAGDTATLTGGGTNTNVYIVGADYISDLGDLSTLAIDSNAAVQFSVASKRLRELKIGDSVASNVTALFARLNMGNCDSLETLDARNVRTLTGEVDLSKCPRLTTALFGGTDVRYIILASGSKISSLQVPSSIRQLQLVSLPRLAAISGIADAYANISILRIEKCPNYDGLVILNSIYNTESNTLEAMRFISLDSNIDTAVAANSIVDMLYKIANGKDKDGNAKTYYGVDANGNVDRTLAPVFNGSVNFVSIQNAYLYALQTAYPDLTITADTLIIPDAQVIGLSMVDPAVSYDEGSIPQPIQNEVSASGGSIYENNIEWETTDGVIDSNGDLTLDNTPVADNATTSDSVVVTATSGYNEEATASKTITINRVGMSSIAINYEGSSSPITGDRITIRAEADSLSTKPNSHIALTCDQTSENVTFTDNGDGTATLVILGQQPMQVTVTATNRYDNSVFNSLRWYVNTQKIIDVNRTDGLAANDAALMSVIYAQGWSASADEMYSNEANAITDSAELGAWGDRDNTSQPFYGCTAYNFDAFASFGVTAISTHAFTDWTSLTSIVLPNSVDFIGGATYSGVSTRYGAFSGCTNLSSINTGNVKYFSQCAFNGCTSLTSIDLSSFLGGARGFTTSITTEAGFREKIEAGLLSKFLFAGCTNLVLTELPSNVTEIDSGAFGGCTSLALTSLPNGVQSINLNAFKNNSALALTSLPSGLTSLGESAFEGCSSINITNLPTGLTSIGNSVFKGCTGLIHIDNWPSAVTSIVGTLFDGCSHLTNIVLSNDITTIGNMAFRACSSLALTTLPSSLTSIGSNAFDGCTSLSLTSLPSDLTSIGSNAFKNCAGITMTSLPSGITQITENCFLGCSSLALTSLPTGLTKIVQSAFKNCTSLALTSLPSGLTEIGRETFAGCTGLTHIDNWPSAVTGVYQKVFSGCTNLVSVALSDSITSISANAFDGCTNLALTSLPSSLTTIGQQAFFNCPALAITRIPSGVTDIANTAFRNDTSIPYLIMEPSTVPTLGQSVFLGTTFSIYVPASLIEDYASATNWSSLYGSRRIIAMDSSHTNFIGVAENTVTATGTTHIDAVISEDLAADYSALAATLSVSSSLVSISNVTKQGFDITIDTSVASGYTETISVDLSATCGSTTATNTISISVDIQ